MSVTFRERYQSVFIRVCAFLGEGWRIDKRNEDSHRIYLINPAYRNYTIVARLEKNRVYLLGSVKACKRSNTYSKCTVSPEREPWAIAKEIEKRILIDAEKQIATYQADEAGEQQLKEERRILIHLLSQIAHTSPYTGYYGGLCSIETASGVSAEVKDIYGKEYKVTASHLTKDQLIKLIGFLSTL